MIFRHMSLITELLLSVDVTSTVNTASRLEGLAKRHDVELAVSADVVTQRGFSFPDREIQELEIRGRAAMLETWMIPKAIEIRRFLKDPL